MKMYKLLLFLLFGFFSIGANAINTIEINKTFEFLNLGSSVDFFEDKTNKLQLEELDYQYFLKSESTTINWGYSKSTYWIRTNLINSSDKPVEIFLLNTNHYLETFNLFLIRDTNNVKSYALGSISSNKSSPVPIPIDPGESLLIVIQVKSNSVLRLPVFIFNDKALSEHKQSKNILAGVFIGIFIFLIGVTAFIALALKEKIYITFGLFVLFYSIYFIGSENFMPKVLMFGKYDFLLKSTVALLPLIQLCYIYFSKLFFDLRSKIAWIHRTFVFMLSATVIIFILFPVNYYLANRLLFYVPSIFGLALFGISLYVWLRLNRVFLRFYVLATFFVILGVTLHNLSNSGFLENQFLAFNSLKISYLLMIAVFSYALTDRFLLFSRNFTNILNEKVEERTTELEKALTDLKTKQQQLIHADKMSTVGVLTAGLAHELNNPLNYIHGGVEYIKTVNEKNAIISDEEALNAIGYIEAGVKRATSIVASILEFSDGKNVNKTKHNIVDIIDRTLNVLKPKLSNGIRIEKEYASDSTIYIDSGKMHQAMLAILDNAIYYAKQSESKPFVGIKTTSKLTYYEITIFNNGPAVPEDQLPRIFDPFYTTKEVGEGTGLGLSSVLTIIQEHNGSIEASNLSNGVIFTIKLPGKKGS